MKTDDKIRAACKPIQRTVPGRTARRATLEAESESRLAQRRLPVHSFGDPKPWSKAMEERAVRRSLSAGLLARPGRGGPPPARALGATVAAGVLRASGN